MRTEEIMSVLDDIAKKYPHKESAMLPALYTMQRLNNNSLSEQGIQLVARALGVSASRVFGVATYYTMFNKKPVGKYHLQVDTNISAMLMGAEEIVVQLESMLDISVGETTSDGRFTLSTVEDLGSGGTCPVVQVNDIYYERMTREKVASLIASLKEDKIPPKDVPSHIQVLAVPAGCPE